MSLQTRITDLAQAIGLDIKRLDAAGGLPSDRIPAGAALVITAGKQMPVYGAIAIEGTLDVQGKLVLT